MRHDSSRGGRSISGKGFISIKVWGDRMLILSHFFKYPMKMKLFGLTETKLFHFHRISKIIWGMEGGSSEPL